MTIDPVSGRAYVHTDLGGYYSDDGVDWFQDDLPKLYAIDPQNPQNMLAASLVGVQHSANGGLSWQQANTGLDQVIIAGTDSLLTDPETVYVSTHRGFARSLDGGATWDYPALGRSTRGLAVDPATPGLVYAGEDHGAMLYISSDYGSSWESVRITETNALINAVVVDPNDSSTVYASLGSHWTDPSADTTWDGLYVSYNGGVDWSRVGMAGQQVAVIKAVQSVTGTIMYTGVNDWNNLTAPGGVYRRLPGEADFTLVGLAEAPVNALTVDPADPQHLFCGAGNWTSGPMVYGLWESQDGGENWTKVNAVLPDSPVVSVLFDPLNSSIVYAGGDLTLFRSLNGGLDWQVVQSLDYGAFLNLHIAVQDHNILYAGMGDGLYSRIIGANINLDPITASELDFSSSSGASIHAVIPAGAASQTATLSLTELYQVPAPPGLYNMGLTFQLDALQNGSPLPNYSFSLPIEITLNYPDIAGLLEESIYLMVWDGSGWVDAASTCNPASSYVRLPAQNQLLVQICHLSQFGLFGQRQFLTYLPLVVRKP